MVEPATERADTEAQRGAVPVVGVLLVVAIVVILSAAITAVVLDITEGASDPAPTAAFSPEIDNDTGKITITHVGGETIGADTLRFEGALLGENQPFDGETVEAGDSVTLLTGLGDEISLVYEDPDTEYSYTLDRFDVSDVLALEPNATRDILGTGNDTFYNYDCNGTGYQSAATDLNGNSVDGYTRSTKGELIHWDGKQVGDDISRGFEPLVIILDIDAANQNVTFGRPIERFCD